MSATPPIARLSVTAIDCPDTLALARFYAAITGGTVEVEQVDPDDADGDLDDGWVEVRPAQVGGHVLAFQRVDDFRPPQWPGTEHPQQAHLDFDVADLDAGEAAVLALGARKAAFQPGTTFRVFIDPAGHPFCLVLRPGLVLDGAS